MERKRRGKKEYTEKNKTHTFLCLWKEKCCSKKHGDDRENDSMPYIVPSALGNNSQPPALPQKMPPSSPPLSSRSLFFPSSSTTDRESVLVLSTASTPYALTLYEASLFVFSPLLPSLPVSSSSVATVCSLLPFSVDSLASQA